MDPKDLLEKHEALLAVSNAVAIGQITASFLHEAKNSLNGMSLMVQNLIEDVQGEASLAKKGDYVERLSILAAEMQRLDDFSRKLQAATLQGLRPEKQECYLNDIVAQTIQLLEGPLRSKGIRPQLLLDPALNSQEGHGSGSPILVDKDQIQRVVINLVLNAIAASPERGHLEIGTKCREQTVEIRVTDYGKGIPKGIRQKLFLPFSTTKEEGMGMGLFISRLLVERNHGGTVDLVNSIPGKGSTFLVQLPRFADERFRAAGIKPRKQAAQTPHKILIVEDEDIARDSLARLLTVRGYKVVKADSGAAAIQQASKGKIGIVLMDIILGNETDGIEAAQRIQRMNPLTSFIFISAFARLPGYLERSRSSGIRVGGWLEKPIHISELIRLIGKEQEKLRALFLLERARELGNDPVSQLHSIRAVVSLETFQELLAEIHASEDSKK